MSGLMDRFRVDDEVLSDIRAALREQGIESQQWSSALSGVRFWSMDLEKKLGDIYPSHLGNDYYFGEIEFARESELWLARETYHFGKNRVQEKNGTRMPLYSNYSPRLIVKEIAQTFAGKYGFEIKHWEGVTRVHATGTASSKLRYKSSIAAKISEHGSLPEMKDYVIKGVLGYIEHCTQYRESIGRKKLRASA